MIGPPAGVKVKPHITSDDGVCDKVTVSQTRLEPIEALNEWSVEVLMAQLLIKALSTISGEHEYHSSLIWPLAIRLLYSPPPSPHSAPLPSLFHLETKYEKHLVRCAM